MVKVNWFQVLYVDNYGEHNLEVMTVGEHDAAHAEEVARSYLCRPLKHIKAVPVAKEEEG